MQKITSVAEAQQALRVANASIALAADWIATQLPTIEQFLEEDQHVDTVMPIVNPTLYLNEERRQVADMLRPVYIAAKNLVAEARKAQVIACEMNTGRGE